MKKIDRVRTAGEGSVLTRWVDNLIVVTLFVFAAFVPHSIAVTQSAWAIGGGLWLARVLLRPRPRFYKSPLDYVLFGFFILTGLSAFLSYEPMLSIGKLRAAALFTIVYLFAQSVRSRRVFRLLVITIVASCFINVLFTAGQRVMGRGVKVLTLKADSPLHAAGVRPGDTLLKVDGQTIHTPEDLANAIQNVSNSTSPVRAAVAGYRHELLPVFMVERNKLLPGSSAADQLGIEAWSKGRDWRASGFFGHYVTYADVLQLVMALAVGLLVSLPIKRSLTGLFLLIAVVGFGFSLALTVTRAAWLAALLSTVVVLFLGTSRRTLVVVALLLVPFVIGGLLVLQQKRNVGFVDQKDQSTTWRQTVWREGASLLVSRPRHLLIGVGPDSIKTRWRQWDMFDHGRIPVGHMHSNVLQIAVERGVPALLLWMMMLGLYLRMMFRTLRKLRQESQDNRPALTASWVDVGATLGAIGGAAGFLTSGLVHYNWGDSEVVMVFYFIMGLMIALHRLVGLDADAKARPV